MSTIPVNHGPISSYADRDSKPPSMMEALEKVLEEARAELYEAMEVVDQLKNRVHLFLDEEGLCKEKEKADRRIAEISARIGQLEKEVGMF